MRKVRLTIIGLISVFVIALLAVNVVSIEKANERHFSEYCSELTRALVKAPLSYKLNDYTVRVSPMTKDELEEVVQMAPFNNIDDACSAQLNQDTFLKEFCSYSMGDRSPLAV